MKKLILRAAALLCCLSLLLAPASAAKVSSEGYEFPDDWSREALVFAVENGIFAGDEHHRLNPEKNITRAEMAAVLVRLLGATEQGNLSAYTDVHTDDWFYRELGAAVGAGVFNGTSNTTMAPNAPITREQAAVVLCRAFGVVASKREAYLGFGDGAAVSGYARDAVSALKEAKIINGYEDGTFRPANSITRAEVAQLLFKMFDCIADTPEEIPASGWVLYRGKAALPETLSLDGTLILGQAMPAALAVTDWNITGTLAVRTGTDTTLDLAGVKTAQLVFAPRSGKLTGNTTSVCLWGGGATYHGIASELIVMGGSHTAIGGYPMLDLRGGSLDLTGSALDVVMGSGAALQMTGSAATVTMEDSAVLTLPGGTEMLTMGNHCTAEVGGRPKTVVMGDSSSLTLNGSAGLLTMGDSSGAIINGSLKTVHMGNGATLSLTGSAEALVAGKHAVASVGSGLKTAQLGDGSTLTLTGDAESLTAENNTTVTITGSLGTAQLGDSSSLTLTGSAETVSLGKNSTATIGGTAAAATVLAGTKLTVNGRVQTLTLDGEGCTVNGSGSVGNLILNYGNCEISVPCDSREGEYYNALQREHDNALNVVKTMRVACTVEKETKLYSNRYLSGYIRTIPAGSIVYNEWHPAGNTFYVSCEDGTKGWVYRWDCYIPDDTVTTDGNLDYSDATKEGFVDLNGYSSKTDYLIWVSRYTQKVIVFQGSKGNWKVLRTFPCSSGANNTPTPAGVFETSLHEYRWNFNNYYVSNVTIFNGDHAFHTILYNYGGGIYDDRVGIPLSHGCIRMLQPDAQYITDLPLHTTVVVY